MKASLRSSIKYSAYGLILGLLMLAFLLIESTWQPTSFFHWVVLIYIPISTFSSGYLYGRKLDWKRIHTEHLSQETNQREHNTKLMYRNMDAMYMELEDKVRQLGAIKEKKDLLEKKYHESEARILHQGEQSERVKKEMESQLQVHSQIEKELLDSQTRLELINSLSSSLFTNTSYKRVLYQTITKTQNIFPTLHVYYASIVEDKELTWVHFQENTRPKTLNLIIAPEYLSLLKNGSSIFCENVSDDLRFKPCYPFFLEKSIQSFIEMPLLQESRLMGVLGFGSGKPHQFTNHEVTTIKELGHFLSVARHTIDLENERAKAVTKLLKAKKTAEDATHAKSIFLSTLSHEIRTPLNGVIGMTQLIMNTNLTDEQAEYTRIANSSGNVLLGLVNDILDFSKIEAGKLDLELAPLNIRHVLEKTCELLAFQAQSKGLEMILSVSPELPDETYGDSVRIRQILMNLISNAIKFTDTGHIHVQATPINFENNNMTLEIRISDTGIGITDQSINRLFKSFSQADSSTTRKYGGTGLGLTICKQLVELMRGKIWVESQPGEGSTFAFTITSEVSETNTYSLPDSELKDHILILTTRHKELTISIEHIVKKIGCQYTVQPLDGDSNFHPLDSGLTQLVLIDSSDLENIGKPLSQLEECYPDYPLILLQPMTSDTVIPDQFIDSITKPLNLSSFHQTLRKVAGLAYHQDRSPEPSGTTSALKSGRVLLVDDHLINRKLCGIFLEKRGYNYDEAMDGLEAVQAVKSNQYDVVLMDCRMPHMDGFQATRAIRELSDEKSAIPIIALTANVMQTEKEACFDAGMDAFLTKPINRDLLYQTIEKLMVHHKPKPVVDLHDPYPEPPSESNHLDLTLLREAMGSDTDMIMEMLELFKSETEHSLQELELAVKSVDHESVANIAHSIKGSCANMGASEMREIALQLEQQSRNQPDKPLKTIVKNLFQSFDNVKNAIEKEKL